MAGLFKRGNTYYIKFYQDGERVRKSLGTVVYNLLFFLEFRSFEFVSDFGFHFSFWLRPRCSRSIRVHPWLMIISPL